MTRKQQVWFRPHEWGALIDLLDSTAVPEPIGYAARVGRKEILRLRADLRRQLKLLEPK